MNYILLLITVFMWSFVGVMVKSASLMFDSGVITFSRFFFGVIFLGLLITLRAKRLKFSWKDKWIWIGVGGKTCNYIFENIAISMGFAYGNIVVWPVQAVILTLYAILYLREKIYLTKIIAVSLCIAGVFLVSWKGMPLSMFIGTNLMPTLFFILSAIGTCFHVISQRKLIMHMSSGNMNFSIFIICSIITVIPLPFNAGITGNFNPVSILSLVGLGVITGASFYIYARVLKTTPFMVVTVISNSTVILTLLWAMLFFHEKINSFIIAGVVILLLGLIVINIPQNRLVYFKNKFFKIDRTDI